MIELLRNCSHGSEISIYLAENAHQKKIVKVATSLEGRMNIERELTGWNWYQQIEQHRTTSKKCKVISKKRDYIKIEINYINGSKGDYKKGFTSERNVSLIGKTIEFYYRYWPYEIGAYAPIHGDLSVDNIIFNSEGINLIDWEHFRLSAAPWGFDALYLLFETLWFNMRSRKLPKKCEIDIVAHNVAILGQKNRLSIDIMRAPLKFLTDFMRDNADLWGDQIQRYKQKFPILLFKREQINAIDMLLREKLFLNYANDISK